MANNAEMWRTARQQISEYEARSSELALVLQSEKDGLQSLQNEAKALNTEKAVVLKTAEEVDGKVQQAREQLVTLKAQAQKAAQEGETLIKHLDLLRDSQRELTTQLEVDRRRHQEHIACLAAKLEQYRSHLNAGGARGVAV